MPSMKFLTRLEETARWYDWNQESVTDPVKFMEFQKKLNGMFFDLFAMASNEFRELKGVKTELERPYWQPNDITTFIERKPPDPDDPD